MTDSTLKRDIAIIIGIKILIILAAAFFVFGPGHRPSVDADDARRRSLDFYLPPNETIKGAPNDFDGRR